MNATVAAAKANTKPLPPLTEIVEVQQIPVDLIAASAQNPRHSIDGIALAGLAASIKAVGIQTPLLLRAKSAVNSMGQRVYEIVSGERRWRAARMAGLKTVPAVVREMILKSEVYGYLDKELNIPDRSTLDQEGLDAVAPWDDAIEVSERAVAAARSEVAP